jgi:hypothetical protein
MDEDTHRASRDTFRDKKPQVSQDAVEEYYERDVSPGRARSSYQNMSRSSVQVLSDFNGFNSSPDDTPTNLSRRESYEKPGQDIAENMFTEKRNMSVSSTDTSVTESGDNFVSLKNNEAPPYHILTSSQKKVLVYIVSMAGMFSPLSSNIYFPAIGKIANVSIEGRSWQYSC